jgi:putative transposase
MLLSQRFEIFPTEEQTETLNRWLQYCRQTYNSSLLDKQRKYRQAKTTYNRFDMQRQLKLDKGKYAFLKQMPAQPLQEVFVRLGKSFTNFFQKRAGFPKIKKYGDYDSMTFPQFGFKQGTNHRYAASFSENGKLQLSKLGEVAIHIHRAMEGPVRQLIIKRKSNRWYAIFSVERQALPRSIDRNNAVGIDVGLNKYAVLSNEQSFENPRFLIKTEKLLKKAQRKLAKKKKGSSNLARQVAKVQQLHEKVSNQRRDFLHKLSYKLSHTYSVIAVENLNIRNMVKNKRLSKSIADAGWGMFRDMLAYKCEREGGFLVKVAPAFTTQDCSSCGANVKKSLSVRTHICKKCGIILDRDHNASLNILNKGLVQLDQLT